MTTDGEDGDGDLPAEASIDMQELMVLGHEWLGGMKESSERDHAANMRRLDLQSAMQEQGAKDAGRRFGLLAITVIAIVALVFGLVFVAGEVESGLLLVSHLITLVAGIVGGGGYVAWKQPRL